MTKNKYYLLAGFLGLLITTALVSSLAAAAEPVNSPRGPGAGPGFDPAKQSAAVLAITNNDYNAWAVAMADHPWATQITEDNWAKFVEMNQHLDSAKALAEELGIKMPGMGPKQMAGHMGGDKDFVPANRQAIQEAIEQGDYAAWQKLVGDSPIASQITEENFAKFVEMHQLMQAGNGAGARAIATELGLEKGPGNGPEWMMGGWHDREPAGQQNQ